MSAPLKVGLDDTLNALDARVHDVARSTSRIGDRLQLADRQRAAAAEARALAVHLSAFNTCAASDVLDAAAGTGGANEGRERGGGGGGGSGTRNIARVFHDPARSAEAARLAQRLLRMAHDAADLERAERVAAAEAHRRRRENNDVVNGTSSSSFFRPGGETNERHVFAGATATGAEVLAAGKPASLAVVGSLFTCTKKKNREKKNKYLSMMKTPEALAAFSDSK